MYNIILRLENTYSMLRITVYLNRLKQLYILHNMYYIFLKIIFTHNYNI